MKVSRPADQDRLPWLEPYRETNKPGRPTPRRGFRNRAASGAALGLLLAVGAGGYWLGQRGETTAEPTPSAVIALPAPKPAPVQTAQAPPAVAEPAPAESQAAAKPTAAKKPTAARKMAKRRSPARRKARSAGVQKQRLNAVRASQERQALSRPWPKMPSPGPAGQVIQLGAFSTATRANTAYYQRIARYKSLAAMPRVVVPVVSKPDGRILYVLRLGTTSRQQTNTVCRNLRNSGDHCLVIG